MMDHVLTRLPIKSVFRFKFVSRLWYSTIVRLNLLLSTLNYVHFLAHHPPSDASIKSRHDFYLFCCDDEEMMIKLFLILASEGSVKVCCDSYQWLGDLSLVGSYNGLRWLASLSGLLHDSKPDSQGLTRFSVWIHFERH